MVPRGTTMVAHGDRTPRAAEPDRLARRHRHRPSGRWRRQPCRSAAFRACGTWRPRWDHPMSTALAPGLDPGLAALLVAIERLGLPKLGEGTPEAARVAFRRVTCDIRP